MSILRRHSTGLRALFGVGVSLAILAGCGETGVSGPIAPGSITAVSSDARVGVAGLPLPELVEILVRGLDNQPLPRAQVTFSAAGGGATVSPASTTTDENGVARTRWTLSTAAGPNILTVTASGVTSTFNATGTAGPAAWVTLVDGDNQSANAGSAVATAPSVRVIDAHANPVAGVPVTFSVLSGGGTVTGFARNTSAEGIATLGSWVLGPGAGPQTLLARVELAGVTDNPIVFTATATAGAAALLTAASATAQTAPVATAVTARPSVRVTDANGNPVASTAVTFVVTAGSGQVTGATQNTNAQGIATVGGWTLGTAAGTNQVTASVAGAGNVVFSATGTAGAVTQLVIIEGNNQQAQISRPVTIPPAVAARDAFGNPAAGVVVMFTATAGSGTVVSGRQVTDAAGIAVVGAWFLGASPGVNTLTASAAGLTSVVFTATATPGTAVSMAPNSVIVQGGSAGLPVSDPPSVVVRDVSGNPVSGVVVTFTVTAGDGTVVGSPATTDANGVASLTSWTLGPQVVTNTVVASAPGLPSVTFTASPGAGAPANVVAIAGDSIVAVQGNPVQPRPTVRVTDANGNRVVGAVVTFAVVSGGGFLTGATQATDAAGVATVGSWVLGSGAPNTLTATVAGAGISGNPVTFTATSATSIAVTSVPAGPLTLGANFSITVRLTDAVADPVLLAGVQLDLTIASGGGTLNGTTAVTTDANGQATFTVNLTGTAGDRTFSISGAGLATNTTAVITFN